MVENATGSAPFGGAPWVLPGFVEAEHFDEGLEGVAYHDVTPREQQRPVSPDRRGYRNDHGHGRGAFHGHPVGTRFVGWMTAGEWLR